MSIYKNKWTGREEFYNILKKDFFVVVVGGGVVRRRTRSMETFIYKRVFVTFSH